MGPTWLRSALAGARRRPFAVALFAAILAVGVARAEEMPPLNVATYPQDTPQKAVASILKAMETREISYWVAHLIVPDETQRLIEKYGSFEKAAAQQTLPRRAEAMRQQWEALKAMLELNKTTEGETAGVKWVRFHGTEKQIAQFEKQPDGRWSMNPRVRAEE